MYTVSKPKKEIVEGNTIQENNNTYYSTHYSLGEQVPQETNVSISYMPKELENDYFLNPYNHININANPNAINANSNAINPNPINPNAIININTAYNLINVLDSLLSVNELNVENVKEEVFQYIDISQDFVFSYAAKIKKAVNILTDLEKDSKEYVMAKLKKVHQKTVENQYGTFTIVESKSFRYNENQEWQNIDIELQEKIKELENNPLYLKVQQLKEKKQQIEKQIEKNDAVSYTSKESIRIKV